MNWINNSISLVALTVSFITLYLTRLRKPRISAQLCPWLILQARKNGEVSFQVPMTILNDGARGDSIFRVALVLFRAHASSQRYFILWDSFLKYNPKDNYYEREDIANALLVPGGTSVSKYVLFSWAPFSHPSLSITEGDYIMEFHFWDRNNNIAYKEIHTVPITLEQQKSLLNIPEDKESTSIYLSIDLKYQQNLSITEQQYADMFKT